ncbi:hypothetical protein B484DRAFT_403852 [Ochromonadaceae sp. CCMP2298]|nr:hypothetical protein B484DRAFT_403852 [Ochromonadaceae sp. CCMP2298]
MDRAELGLLKSAVDLAASRSAHEDDCWLHLADIASALTEVCSSGPGVSRQSEQHMYQVLLRMSADSERHLSWWERLEHTRRYERMVAAERVPVPVSPYVSPYSQGTSLNRSTASASSHPYPNNPYRVHTPHSSPVSAADSYIPSVVWSEGRELSVLLNDPRSPYCPSGSGSRGSRHSLDTEQMSSLRRAAASPPRFSGADLSLQHKD